MSTEAEADSLFNLYDLLQDLMDHHVAIDTSLKELSLKDEDHDLSQIESASTAIIDACTQIENKFKPSKSCCCPT